MIQQEYKLPLFVDWSPNPEPQCHPSLILKAVMHIYHKIKINGISEIIGVSKHPSPFDVDIIFVTSYDEPLNCDVI